MSKKVSTFAFILLLCLNVFSQTNSTNRIYEVWDNEPAPNRGKDYTWVQARGYPSDPDWETHSYPIGNGYMGANIFGRTDLERVQITDKTLANGGPYGSGGMTNFAEIFLEFDHYDYTNYKRSLNLNDGILYVDYESEGVQYSREYLANYPSNVIAIRLTANENSKISCTVSAMIPYQCSSNTVSNSGKTTIPLTKYATAEAKGNTITLAGNVPDFSLNYEGQVKVINEGGEIFANNNNGTNEIRIVNANSAIVLIATGTNYELSDKIFLAEEKSKKLDPSKTPHKQVTKLIADASELGYKRLKASHLQDYQNIFSRVNLEIAPAVTQVPTKTLVDNYKKDPTDTYLEELIFHFGRYLLIASSREKTLPSGLQGVWSQYHVTPFSGGYWHNINVQMNYWGAFNTNMAETFVGYENYFNAYLPEAYKNGDKYIKKWCPDAYTTEEDGNGWCIGTGANAYFVGVPGGHSGPGTGGFTTKLLWERYEFTQDTTFLREVAYPALLGMSVFLSKTLKPDADGILLVDHSASPEQKHNGDNYATKGSTFDQGFVWETYNDLLKSAEILGSNDAFLETVKDQINKLDPIKIGESGQIKEFREEKKYADIGDPKHRHISHLCAIYPGTLINSDHPKWIEAVNTVLDLRGNNTTGWALAHRMNVRARTKEAEEAHVAFSKFLSERTLPNLWTLHPPFQIDGNLGCMAGVAEMLIQSHEGFIEPLPALPESWQTGHYDGLVARGNFVLSLSWTKGKTSSIKLVSRSGNVCRIKYKNIGRAKIKDTQGNTIPYTKKDSNMIEFATEQQGEYHITL